MRGRGARPRRGAAPCAELDRLLRDPLLGQRPIEAELNTMMLRVAGRQLSRQVVGDRRDSASLTDLFALGDARAERVLEHLPTRKQVLEFGGNVGQIGRRVASQVERLVSVDADPAMKVYGELLSSSVEFVDLDGLPADELFDGAYCVGAFVSMTSAEQRAAIEYVHARLAPGARFVIDLGPGGSGPTIGEFTAMVESLFTWRRVPLIDVGFVLTKPAHDTEAAEAPTGRLMVNEESVVADVLDGEVVVVNLDSGAYYVLEGSAASIWQMLAGGMTAAEVAAKLVEVADDAELIESWVDDFVQQLVDEQLLLPASGDVGGVASTDVKVSAPVDPPVMFRYTDMQFLIQMDPIREYDESGWPVRRGARVVRPTE